MTLQVSKGVREEIETLLENAVLAPSSHNTQPWRFHVSRDRVCLYADRTRALPVNDPDDRELTISCGCALMNLRVAAAEFGRAVNVEIRPDEDDEELLAVLEFTESREPADDEARLFPAIADRRTYRKRFETSQVSDSILQKLLDAADQEGVRLNILADPDKRQDVARLVSEGDSIQWSNPSWRRELAAWMHPRRQGDGLTVPWLVGPMAQAVIRTFDMGNGVAAKDAELAKESPVLAVLVTDRDEVSDWMRAGQALERLLLTARREGLQASYLNQPIQVASLRPKLQRATGRPGFPQIVLRIGYPGEELPATPRRDLQLLVE